MENKKKLYVVANAHLDTQWNWTIQETIREYVKNTLVYNFELMDKYPHYRMNFEGAFRYKLAKEYYPDLYEKLKGYIAEGRWNVAGSTWDAMDANVPSSEALMRQILYGNGFFEKEFGKKSTDIFLTDCFGFRYALPSIEAHMGLNGFSTQKLVWGSGGPMYEKDGSVSKPQEEEWDSPDRHPRMDLGKWMGPDGNYIIGSFLQGDYTYNFEEHGLDNPINTRERFLRRIDHNEKFTGTAVYSMLYGTGDYGGSCKESSAKMVNEAVLDNGNENALFEVISASTDQLYNELTKEQIDALPVYDNELLIPHGSGALTSHTINKRWNRKNELLADSAERAAVISAWLGSDEYPAERLLTAWQTFLWHQFHDDLPGTSIAAAYTFTYNDYVIALNMFASELQNAVGGVVRTMDTNVQGTPVVVYNPVSCTRNDVVSAEIDIKSEYVRVFDAHGNEVPAQITVIDGKKIVKFAAKTAPVSCTVYDVRESDTVSPIVSEISVKGNVLENQRYIVTIDENGDIASIIDKANGNFELLKSPAQLEIGPDSSTNWPSWELVWTDSLKEPKIVGGKAEIEVVDNGPAVVSLKVKRSFEGSEFEQIISLTDGGQRVDVNNRVNWFCRESNLRAAFHLNVSNPKATFDLGLGAIESGNTDSYPYYQHVAHQWADLTAEDGSYGVSILNDCKYGMDKPTDDTLRLTLIHTPPVNFMQESGQDWQDMGLNIFAYSICGHNGFRDDTNKEAAELNQPMIPFTAQKHEGKGRELSFVSVSDDAVITRAVEKEEKGERIIVRIQETSGKGCENVKLTFAGKLTSVTETNGYEDEIGAVEFEENSFTVDLTKYAVKTFAITLESADCGKKLCEKNVALPYNKKVTSYNSDRTAGEFADGISIPAELYEENVKAGGIRFTLASADENNAVVCDGQTIRVPSGSEKLYILAASVNGDKTAQFSVGGKTVEIAVQDFKANVGSWDMITNGAERLVKRDEIAVNYTHTHNAEGDRLYLFAYLFKYEIDVKGADSVSLPADSDIIIRAATAVNNSDETAPLADLYDRDEHEAKPVHKVKVLNAAGEVVSEEEHAEDSYFVAHTKYYADGKVFDGWDCEHIVVAKGADALIKMPACDITVNVKHYTLGEDVLTGKFCQASSEFAEDEKGMNAINGRDEEKWCAESKDGKHWLEVDAGEVYKVGSWFNLHCGAFEDELSNASDYRLFAKKNSYDDWSLIDTVKDNRETAVKRDFEPVEARYFRLVIDKPERDGGDTVRLYMFQVYKA